MRRVITVVALLTSFMSACDSSKPSAADEPTGRGSNATATPSAQAPPSSAANAGTPEPSPSATTASRSEPEIIAAQHVLVAFKGAKRATVKRSKAEAKKIAEDVAKKAHEGADFSELAKKYSDEPGAAERLGNLGKFKRDVMAKPFADAAFALEVGKVSDVVETDFGFHVIKRNQ